MSLINLSQYVKSDYEKAIGKYINESYVLSQSEDLQPIIDSGYKLIQLNPSYSYSMNNISIPSGVAIIGNGATITSPSTDYPVFTIESSTTDVFIKDVNFVGATSSPNNAAMVSTDCAIYIDGAKRIKIKNNYIKNFLGAAIVCKGYGTAGQTAKDINNYVTENTIITCYMAILSYYYHEYSSFLNNNISWCRLGIWSQSGNNDWNGNFVTKCRAAFVSSDDTNSIVDDAGGNRQHGTVTGNTFNHCRSDQTTAWNSSNYTVNSVDYQGIWIDGANTTYPPTYSANTQYYTDLTYINSASSGISRWNLTGCLFSNCTISSDVNGSLAAPGCTVQASVTGTNCDGLDGWKTPTFINSWAEKTGGFIVRYMKDASGQVKLRGIVDSGSANTVAFVLPVGYRPTTNSLFFPSYQSASIGKISVDTDGNVKIVTLDTYASLDAVIFETI